MKYNETLICCAVMSTEQHVLQEQRDAVSALDGLALNGVIPEDVVVLVVEDDEFQRATLIALFASANKTNESIQFDVHICESASAALEMLQSPECPETVDLILLDVFYKANEKSGCQLLPELRTMAGARCAIVMLSAHQEFALVRECMQQGANAYLMKPIRAQEVRHLWQYAFRITHGDEGGAVSGRGQRDCARTPRATPFPELGGSRACDPGPRAPGTCQLNVGPRPRNGLEPMSPRSNVAGPRSGGQRALSAQASSQASSQASAQASAQWSAQASTQAPSPRPSRPALYGSNASPTGAGGNPVHSRCRQSTNRGNNTLKPLHLTDPDDDSVQAGCAQQ